MQWQAGILRGHSGDCPHQVSKPCQSQPPPLVQPTNADFPHLTHAVSMAITLEQVQSMILEAHRALQPIIPSVSTSRHKRDLSEFCSGTFDESVLWMWHMCRTGIAVSIREGKLKLFVPFCNTSYANMWSDRARSMLPCEGLPAHGWWANGWTLCGDKVSDQYWGDQGVCAIQNMILTACNHGIVSDCDFIINKRDSACVRRDKCDALNPIDAFQTPLHRPFRLIPVLSLYTGDQFSDVAMPLPCDWQRMMKCYYQAQRPVAYTAVADYVDWGSKRDCAVFRGGLTGTGASPLTNQRMALLLRRSADFDVKGTSWNQRYKYCPVQKQIAMPMKCSALDVGCHNYLTLQEQQSKYRYVVTADGHSGADRLGALMCGNQNILKISPPQHALCPDTWVSQRVHAWQHYIPVRSDMADLEDKLQWARSNEESCRFMREQCSYWSSHEKEDVLQWWTDITADMSKLPQQ